jgi:hypothetical protein
MRDAFRCAVVAEALLNQGHRPSGQRRSTFAIVNASHRSRHAPVKAALLTFATLATLLLPACAVDPKEAAAREWQRSECNRALDSEARERCLKRVDR